MYRPTYVEINGDNLESNVKNIIKNYPSYKYYFGVVKNNAYHHGFYSVKYLINGGVNYLAVSSLEEALEVRKYNNEIPILILEPIKPEYIYDAINSNITITVSSMDQANDISMMKFKDKLKIHLKVDSGMNRLGFKDKTRLARAYNVLKNMKNVEVEGLYTHFATSGVQDRFYNQFLQKFREITSSIDLSEIEIVHADRSITLTTHDKIREVNGVRLGIIMYGFDQKIPEGNIWRKLKRKFLQKELEISNVHLTNNLKLKYAFNVISEVIESRRVMTGEAVGYGQSFSIGYPMYIATVPIGYADGVTKEFSKVIVNGRKCKIAADSMDMIMIVSEKLFRVGDKVVIIGSDFTIRDISNRLHENAYHTLNRFSTRLAYIYEYKGERIEVKY